jgi:hypothetical protein
MGQSWKVSPSCDGPRVAEKRVYPPPSAPRGTVVPLKRYVRTIPLSWLQAATALPGKALHVGLLVWFYTGLHPERAVVLTHTKLALFHLKRETARRGLAALEAAGLVRVTRAPRKSPRVHLLAWEPAYPPLGE